jgi:hypothetical protein
MECQMKIPSGRTIKSEDIKFGPRIISEFQRRREAEGRIWAEGYTQDDLDSAQEKFGIRFPPDLVALFLERRPVLGWDWRSDEQEIRAMLERPFQGLLFDVEQSGLWWPEWGDRPAQGNERAEILRSVLRQAPKLVPLLSHRYIPSEPHEPGNPVFSIYQSDIIYYGKDLADYFERELGNNHRPIGTPTKHIRFWSDLVERAYQAPFYPGRAMD